ncbi:suppressor of fused domain protein [Streptomyces sp. NPDC058954]|uniref:suppressor of fused domain protein n=1 Tax=Streptomyces sp. NPDC058954 TaxID=3346677 RepID=UPI003683F4E5
MNEHDTDVRFSRFLEQLLLLTGKKPTEVHEIAPAKPEDGRVRAVVYADTPEPGYVTGFSYGLSLVRHPNWMSDVRELVITVRSHDIGWASVPAETAAALRGICAYDHGQAIGYMKPYVESSEMSSIVVADPAVRWSSGPVDLGPVGIDRTGQDLVDLVGLYPVYASERDFVYAKGFDALWRLEWDRFDPLRLPVA